ncbi:MAG: hypothetical protein K2G87_11265 [Oscillospiraceae bacterium]|nr:hypothetical protein [Oscillospiraceae bacterium]
MKKKLFSVFLMCAVSAMLFSGCDYDPRDEHWVGKMREYSFDLAASDSEIKNIDSAMKNIDYAHKEAFDSAFNDIEIFGARLCVPMKLSELPDKFEVSSPYSEEYISLSEKEPYGTEFGGGLKSYVLDLYYDREVQVARVYVICRKDQSLEDGIIYELYCGLLNFQPVFLGGQIDVNSNIDEIKEFLGEGNEYYGTLLYTDGNRIIEIFYSKGKCIACYIRTYNNF